MDENILTDNFHDVVNKAFDQDMGFGYISEHGYQPRAKVILQGRNPFVDNHSVCTLYDSYDHINHAVLQGMISPMLGEYLPYSQVYHLAWDREGGTTYCILR